MAVYGKMSGVAFPDFVHARVIVVWGGNPSESNIHLIPYLNEARKRGAKLVVLDPRRSQFARHADLHLAVWPGSDLMIALWLLGGLYLIFVAFISYGGGAYLAGRVRSSWVASKDEIEFRDGAHGILVWALGKPPHCASSLWRR